MQEPGSEVQLFESLGQAIFGEYTLPVWYDPEKTNFLDPRALLSIQFGASGLKWAPDVLVGRWPICRRGGRVECSELAQKRCSLYPKNVHRLRLNSLKVASMLSHIQEELVLVGSFSEFIGGRGASSCGKARRKSNTAWAGIPGKEQTKYVSKGRLDQISEILV